MPSGLQGRRLSPDCHNSRPLPFDRLRIAPLRPFDRLRVNRLRQAQGHESPQTRLPRLSESDPPAIARHERAGGGQGSQRKTSLYK
jgi:hypothetical protein